MVEEAVSLVFDNGSGTTKAGFSGNEAPLAIFPSIVGRLKQPPKVSYSDFFVGNEAQKKREFMNLTYPVQHGIVTNWEDMEAIWSYTFSELKVSSQDLPVLLTEPSLNPQKNREKKTEIMFEKFNIPALYVAEQTVLSMYASGRGAGIVVDLGHDLVQTLPIYQGFAVSNPSRFHLAGSTLDGLLINQMKEKSFNLETARQIKEKFCYVALDSRTELIKEEKFRLPDGREVTLGSERFRCPEVLFQPSLLGSEALGIDEIIHDAIQKCDEFLRKDFYANVLLCGGTSMLTGIAERLKKELVGRAPGRTFVGIVTEQDRMNSVWIGGSILASLSSFQEMWVTKKEFQEAGAGIAKKKFTFVLSQ